MNDKDLLEKEVVAMNGWKIGKSKEIIFDNNNWQITYLNVELKGNIENELGWDSVPLSHNRLPISISQVMGVGDMITLKLTKEELIPMLTKYVQSQKSVAQPETPTTYPPTGVSAPF